MKSHSVFLKLILIGAIMTLAFTHNLLAQDEGLENPDGGLGQNQPGEGEGSEEGGLVTPEEDLAKTGAQSDNSQKPTRQVIPGSVVTYNVPAQETGSARQPCEDETIFEGTIVIPIGDWAKFQEEKLGFPVPIFVPRAAPWGFVPRSSLVITGKITKCEGGAVWVGLAMPFGAPTPSIPKEVITRAICKRAQAGLGDTNAKLNAALAQLREAEQERKGIIDAWNELHPDKPGGYITTESYQTIAKKIDALVDQIAGFNAQIDAANQCDYD